MRTVCGLRVFLCFYPFGFGHARPAGTVGHYGALGDSLASRLIIRNLLLTVFGNGLSNLAVKLHQEIGLSLLRFVDRRVDVVLEGVAILEDGVSPGEGARLEELLPGEIADALAVDGELAEPPHEILTRPRNHHLSREPFRQGMPQRLSAGRMRGGCALRRRAGLGLEEGVAALAGTAVEGLPEVDGLEMQLCFIIHTL